MTPAEWSLVADNLGLIGWAFRRMAVEPHESAEAWDAGLDGLMLAARRFDPDMGRAFSTLAGRFVRWRILTHRVRREKRRAAERAAFMGWAYQRRQRPRPARNDADELLRQAMAELWPHERRKAVARVSTED